MASALSLFVKKGYERTTFTDIAARLKLTKGAVYWHFASKEALLMALVDEMSATFEREMIARMPKDELTFVAVAEMMVDDAQAVLADPVRRDYFLLMRTQIRWGAATMDRVRSDLMTDQCFGPWHAFVQAVENDRRAGRVNASADAWEIACLCMSICGGIVQAQLNGFIPRERMEAMMMNGLSAIWRSIAVGPAEEGI